MYMPVERLATHGCHGSFHVCPLTQPQSLGTRARGTLGGRPMSPDLRLMSVSVAAYVAAGIFYVLRGLSRTRSPKNQDHWDGLSVVVLFWFLIVVGNLLLSYRKHTVDATLRQFLAEAAPPLGLFVIGLICGIKPIIA
jgi:hypothetical protein